MEKHHSDPRRGLRRGGRRRALLTSTTLAMAVLIASPMVRAKEQAATPPGGEGGLEEIVVTGTATAGGLKKMDTSFSVTSLSAEAIKEANIIAPADILKQSPGVFVESSGGRGSGANVEVTGFPSSGQAPFVTFQLNGASLFPMPGQNYLDGPSLLLPDDTVQRIELVQGGPGVLYGNGQPGLTANYILKRGTDNPSGDFGVIYGFEGSERVDGFLGGALDKAAGLYGSIGGYWNRSDGVRNPQFTADQGGQVTATLAKDWDDGTLLVYGRYEHFNDQFVTDTPLLNPAPGQFAAYPGFNPLTGTMASKADQHEQIQVAPCSGAGCTPGTIPFNLANGRGPELKVIGADFNWDFGHGLQLLDDLSYSDGAVSMNSIYSAASPTPLSSYIASKETSNKLPSTLAINAVYTTSGAAVPLTQNVLTEDLRWAKDKYHSISNEVHLSKDLFPGNTLTVGNITALYGATFIQYDGSDILLPAVSNPTPIGITLSNGANSWQVTSPQGITNGVTGATGTSSTGYNTAFFLSDSWKLDKWLFDAGIRTERQMFNEHVWNTASADLDGNPNTLWTTGQYFVPGYRTISYRKTASSWTAGLNYEITPTMSAYARVNEGVHFPSFSDLSGLPAALTSVPLERAHNYQAGYKYQSDWIAADLSAYYRSFANVPVSSPVLFNGVTVNGSFAYGSETKGLAYNVTLKPFSGVETWDGFTFAMAGDYAYGHYTNSNGCVSYTGIVNQTVCSPTYNYDGNLLARQPVFQTRLTPAYTLPTDWGSLRAWSTIEYVGRHYGDLLEQQYLGSYYDLSFGMTGEVGSHWEVNLMGTNMTDQIGLTEGNARVLVSGTATGAPILARSIEGREVSLQVKYKL